MKQKSEVWLLIACGLMILLTSIDFTAVNLIISPLSKQLKVPLASTQWILTSYLLVYASLIIAGGRLGDLMGVKRILFIGLALFVIGSICASLARGLALIIIGRVIQGVGAGFVSPNTFALLYLGIPDKDKGFATGIISSVLGAGIGVGPFIGGLLNYLYSWRLVFLINIPLCLLAAIIIACLVESAKVEKGNIKLVDCLGIVYLAVCIFSLIAFIDSFGKSRNWMPIALIVAFLIFLAIFIIHEKRCVNPIFSISLFQNSMLLYGCFLRLLFAIPIMILAYFSAIYLQKGIGYNSMIAGLMNLPFTVIMVFASPFFGKLVDKIGHVKPLALGTTLFIFANVLFIFIGASPTLFWLILLFILVGVAISLMRPSIVAPSLSAAPKEALSSASGIFNTMHFIGTTIGVALGAMMLKLFQMPTERESIMKALPNVMFLSIAVLCIIFLLTVTKFKNYKAY